MALLDNPNPCASVSNPQNTFFVDPNTNKISINSSQNTSIPITENCCNVVYLGNLMGNGPFIWQNGACYYGSIPSEPSSTCSTIFNPEIFTFTTGSSNQIIVQSVSDGSQVSLSEPCCNPVFLTPILGPNTYLWNNGVCYVNFIPTPPTIPPDCVEASNPLNSWNIGPENEVILLGATLTQNCCNNTVLSYIDPQANFIWQNGICYLNSAPSIPEPPEGTEETPCCYNPSTPITARITTSDQNINSRLNQIQTYDSEVNLFDNWVELKATIPLPEGENTSEPTTRYFFDLNLEITNGVNCCCDYNIFVDDIKVICTSGLTDYVYKNKCPGFTLSKVIDNKKSWVYNPGTPEVGISVYDEIERNDGSLGTIAGEGNVNRIFAPSPDADIPWRYTDYFKQSGVFEKHSNLVINSKELWLTFDMCADCPISGTTQICPDGYQKGVTELGTIYCFTTTGYTISPVTETPYCYTLNSSTDSYNACANYALDVGNYYSGEVIISAGTLNQKFLYNGFTSNASVLSIATQSDGKILVGGLFFTTYSGITVNSNIIRLNSDGSLDNTFTYSGPNGFNPCWEIVVQPDGKILIGWGGGTSNALERVNSDGSVDPTFNLLNFDTSGEIYTIKLNTDGSMYVGGSFQDVSSLTYRIVKVTSGGTIDTSFNSLGKVSLADILDIETLSDGTVIMVGSVQYTGTNGSKGISFINPDGTANTNYPPNRNVTTNMGPPLPFYSGGSVGGFFTSVTVKNDDIYVVGQNNYPTKISTILKIKSGTTYFDPDFVINAGTSFGYYPENIKIDSDGNLIVVGGFTTFKGIPTKGIAKIDPNGNLIQNFNVGSGFNTMYPVETAISSDNNIIAVGYFNSYNGCSTNKIVKINNLTATTIPNCYNVVSSTTCNGCCSYTATNFVGPYSDSGCTNPSLGLILTIDPIDIPTVTYLSLFDLEQYKKQFQSFWIPFVEQFVPATTIWVAGERWCNDPCPTEVDCGFELTSEDAFVQTIEQKSFTSANGAKSFTSTTPENLKSSASFGSPSGNDANSTNSNENVIITEDVGLVNQNVITKTFAENNIDIQAYRSKFTAYRTQTITI